MLAHEAAEVAEEESIVRAPLGSGAGVFAPNIKLGLFGIS